MSEHTSYKIESEEHDQETEIKLNPEKVRFYMLNMHLIPRGSPYECLYALGDSDLTDPNPWEEMVKSGGKQPR